MELDVPIFNFCVMHFGYLISAKATWGSKHKDAKNFVNNLNSVLLTFIR